MELKKIVTFLLAAVVATSCRNADITPVHPGTVVLPVKLKTKNESKPLRMSDIFEDVSYVYLDDSDDSDGESLIGKISDIRITDGGIYVGDAFNNIVLQFDKSGKFIRRFSHHGRGRGEYVSMMGFDVCGRTGKVSIYDMATHRVCVYSPEDEFLYYVPIGDDVPRDFAVLDNGDYVFFTHDYMQGVKRGIWQVDSTGVFKRQIMTMDDDYLFNGGLFPRYFHHYGDQVYTSATEYRNELYRIGADTAFVAYQLDVDIKIPKSVRRNPVALMENHIGSVYSIFNYMETETWMTVSLTDMEKQVVLFYDKKTKECHYVETDDDIEYDVPNIGRMTTATKDAIIGVLSPDYIMSFKVLQDRFPTISENSNPVLAICKTK